MNKQIMKALFPEEVARVESGKCPLCSAVISVEDFRDEKSLKEFNIGGMCQKCQDEIFDHE